MYIVLYNTTIVASESSLATIVNDSMFIYTKKHRNTILSVLDNDNQLVLLILIHLNGEYSLKWNKDYAFSSKNNSVFKELFDQKPVHLKSGKKVCKNIWIDQFGFPYVKRNKECFWI